MRTAPRKLTLDVCLKMTAAGIAAASIAGAAHATTVYDSPLAAPGVYTGDGNPNEGFTVNTQNGVELGLGVQYRVTGPQVHPGNTVATQDIYHVNTGPYTGVTSPCATCASWNYEFSINLFGAGLKLQDVSYSIDVLNVGNNRHISYPASALDNTGWNGSENLASANTTTDYGAQNSQNLGFFYVSLLNPLFNFSPLTDDTYIITLSLTGPNSLDVSVSETVIAGAGATPLPAALPLFASGLGVFGFVARRKRNKKAAAKVSA